MEEHPSIGFQLVVIFILIIANGLFAMTEIAIVSSRKARLERRAQEGSAGAKAALKLVNDPTQLLSTVQVGISVIGIATGAYGGTTVAHALAPYLQPLPLIGEYAVPLSMAVAISGLTYFSLIIGELVPKKMALTNPEPLAITVAIPMRMFARVFAPLVRLLSVSTDFILKLLGANHAVEPGVTEEEIKIMIAEGTASGTFEEAERNIVDRVFRLGDMRVSSLMTPKNQIDWIDLEEDAEHNWKLIANSNHSRLPVARGSLDDIVGVVYARDILAVRHPSLQVIEDNVQEPLFIPRSLRAFKLLEQFQQSGTHIAFVMDEFGGMVGLVTLYDLLEQLVGELPQEEEEDQPGMVRRDDRSWLIDGLLPIEEFMEAFSIDKMPTEDRDHYQTLGGFITSYLGSMPQTGQTFEWAGLRFEVVDLDGLRIDKLLITQLDTEEDEDDCGSGK